MPKYKLKTKTAGVICLKLAKDFQFLTPATMTTNALPLLNTVSQTNVDQKHVHQTMIALKPWDALLITFVDSVMMLRSIAMLELLLAMATRVTLKKEFVSNNDASQYKPN